MNGFECDNECGRTKLFPHLIQIKYDDAVVNIHICRVREHVQAALRDKLCRQRDFTLSVSDDARRRTAAFYAPSKTFSLAGLIGSYHIIPDPWLRDRVTRQGDLSHYNSCNVLSLHALLGAYSDEGAQWLDELRPVLADNIRYACDFIAAHFPGVQVMQPQGTYMLFLDCAAWLQEHHMTLRELEERGARAGVIWQDGAAFAWPDSIRMNLALPHSRLVEAMERLRVHAFC